MTRKTSPATPVAATARVPEPERVEIEAMPHPTPAMRALYRAAAIVGMAAGVADTEGLAEAVESVEGLTTAEMAAELHALAEAVHRHGRLLGQRITIVDAIEAVAVGLDQAAIAEDDD